MTKEKQLGPDGNGAASTGSRQTLRKRAEDVFRGKTARMPGNVEALSPEAVRQTLHELRVHQIELEMQNEELRQAQAELEASRVRYFDLYDLAPVGYCTLSEKGLILEANLTAATLLGVARGALVKQLLTRFILKEDQAIYYGQRKLLFETGTPQAWELRMVKKDGTVFWAHLEAIAALNADGAPVCRVGLSDIPERRRAEEALKRAQDDLEKFVADRTEGLMRVNEELKKEIAERMRVEEALKESKIIVDSIVENVPLMIFLKEATDLRFVLFNRAGEELLGYDRKDLLGKNNLDLFPPEQAAHFMAKDREVLDGEVDLLDIPEEPIHTAKKGQRWLHTRKVCIKGADGVTKYLFGISEDITERKQAEEKIQASLLEKETMLKEIHHRVKNNLQIIASLLNTQSSYLQDDKAREALQESIARVRTMAMIHTQLYEFQDLTRIDFGIFLRELVGGISQSYGRAESPVEINVDAKEIGFGIDTSIPCGLILNELVSNALKHAFPEGKEGAIHIRMRMEDNQVVLSVQDNGIGFPKSFDLTNVKSMGLQLVNILVRQMNGKMDMQVDSGTTWTITFSIIDKGGWQNGSD